MNGARSGYVVAATGFLTLILLILMWGLRGTLEECCKTMQEKMSALQKTADQINANVKPCPLPPPGPSPTIEVGPGGGSQAVWKLDGSQVSSWDTHTRIPYNFWGSKLVFKFLPQTGQPYDINRYVLVIKASFDNVERTIEITKSSNNQIGWLIDSVPIDKCDPDPNSKLYPPCDGSLPREFNGTIVHNGLTSPATGSIQGTQQTQVNYP